ncbi:phosphoglycerate kinase [Streptomyces violascens]|uniref:phosphoglycerate kinase n=1 Tax=Streptomyces violascens TaxID=67381 RepID=UPI003662ADF9
MASEQHAVSDQLLDGIPQLSNCGISPGDRWIFSAGFNVDAALTSTGRIDTELGDLRALSDAGARVAVLSHQGSHLDGSAAPLDHVATYLAHRLARPVRYCAQNASAEAARTAMRMRPGEIVIFGNTREHSGEEHNDPGLAARFARLGDRVAVGGFSKAHRSHASNTGLLRFLPGYAADSLLTEAARLAPWARPESFRAAVVGGRKPEKTLMGLAHFVRSHRLVVPGGLVLHALLRALGLETGASELGSRPEHCLAAARSALATTGGARLHIPRTVWVAPVDRPGRARPVPVVDGVPAGHAIVDFTVEPWALHLLSAADRTVIAGTPCRYLDGHRGAADAILRALSPVPATTLLLGGDTVAELPWAGPTSTGGGSALELLATDTCAVFEALRANAVAPPSPTHLTPAPEESRT